MDLERTVKLAQLLDHYGELVTSRQREALHLYCEEDFSLAEVADHFGTSRQAVHDCLRRAIQTLERADQSLGLVADAESHREQLDKALALVQSLREADRQERNNRLELEELDRLLGNLRNCL